MNDLQELSRVEAGAYQINLESLSPANLIGTVITYLNRQFEEKGILLEEKLDANLPNVFADKDRILQVLTNLIGNALQYTAAGGESSYFCYRSKVRNPHLHIRFGYRHITGQLVVDFQSFSTELINPRARASGGSGIGLTIAQALVKAHHGRIWAESPGEGKGSTFTFSLPAIKNKDIQDIFIKALH